jgi:dTDP-4-dehydrorhamnose reductase
MTKVLIIGADGQLGSALCDRLRQEDHTVLSTTRRAANGTDCCELLDLSDRDAVQAWMPPSGIEVAYLCAAMTSIAQCEKQPELSDRINLHSPVVLAQKLLQHGIFVVFISTMAVYDGSVPHCTADKSPCPVNRYGHQKAEAERQIAALGGAVAIPRFTKVLTPQVPILQNWVRSLRHGEPIRPFINMVTAPISLDFAIEVLVQILHKRLTGIVQISGPEDWSYLQIARYLQEQLDVAPDLVEPMRAEAAGLEPQLIPTHTTLDMTRLNTELGLTAPPIATTLDALIPQL